MDPPRAIQDTILLHVDEEIRDDLLKEVQVLGHHASINADYYQPSQPVANESTPLFLKAGKTNVSIDMDVDLCALDRKFKHEEDETIRMDRHAPLLEIAQEEATSLLKLALPMTGNLVIAALAGIIGGVMLGNVSGTQSAKIIAASSLSDLFASQVINNLLGGLGNAVDTVCAQSFGAKKYTQLWIYLQAGLLAYGYCVPIIIGLGINGAAIFRWLGQDPELAELASIFIVLSLLALPFMIASSLARSALMAQSIVSPIVIASVVSYAISLPLGYVLGFHTSLGYVGIIIYSIVNAIIQAMGLGYAVSKNSVLVDSWPGWRWREAHAIVVQLKPLGGSCILMVAFQNLGFSMVALLSGLLPNAAAAMSASTIALSLLMLSFVPLSAIYGGGAIRVGIALGAGKARRAAIASYVTIAASVVTSFACVVLCSSVAKSFASSYTTDIATAQAATSLIYALLPLVVVAGGLFGVQSVYHACGEQWLSARLNFVCMLVVGVPLGAMLAKQFDLGIVGLWYGQIFGVFTYCIASAVWLSRLDWQQAAHEAHRNAHLHVETTNESEPTSEPSTASEPPYH